MIIYKKTQVTWPESSRALLLLLLVAHVLIEHEEHEMAQYSVSPTSATSMALQHPALTK